jgi:hypothetical protein
MSDSVLATACRASVAAQSQSSVLSESLRSNAHAGAIMESNTIPDAKAFRPMIPPKLSDPLARCRTTQLRLDSMTERSA